LAKDFYIRNEGRGQNSIALDGGMAWRLGSSCSGRVQGSWTTRETGAADFVLVVAGNVNNTDFLFSATCNPGYGLVPSFSFAAGQQRFEPEFRSIFDVDYWSIGGSLGYQVNPDLQVGVQVNQQNSSFPNQPLLPLVDPDGPVNALTALSLSGFGSYLIGTSVSANVTIGWTKSDSDNPLIQDFSGLTGNVNLSYAGPRYGATFFFGRNVNLGNVGGANLRIRSSVGVSGSYRLTPQIDLSTGFSYDKDDNRGDIRLGPFINLVDQQFWRAFATASYQATSRLVLNLGYRYESRAFQEIVLDDIPIFLRAPAASHSLIFGLRFDIR
jgi:opacity protein-like surface antigen